MISTPNSRLWQNSTDWLVGFYGSKLDEKNTNLNQFTDSAHGYIANTLTQTDYTLSKLASFAQLDHRVRATTKVTAGLRLEQHQADFSSSNGIDAFKPSETLWGANLTLTEQLTPIHSSYASIARGYKAAGYNPGLPAGSNAKYLRYASETAINYELGLKSNHKEQGLKTKLSVFYTDRQNPQFDGYSYDPAAGTNYVFYTENFSKANNYGLEGEFNWQPQARWQVFGSAGLLMTDVSGTPLNSNFTISGRQQAHAPSYQAMLGTQYRSAQGYFVRIDTNAVDRFYFDNVHNIKSDAYTLWNARVGYQAKDWEIFLWGRNITDERYATRGYYFGNDPTYTAQTYLRLGDRQQFGLTTRFYF